MPPIPIKIVDNCRSVAPTESFLYNKLKRHFNVELSDDPHYLFYSVFGNENTQQKYDRCVKIWFTGENFRPDFTKCDYALSFDYLENESRHLRLPLYLHYTGAQGSLVKRADFDALSALRSKARFCNFVYSNGQAATRIKFFKLLSEYKQVDSGGSVHNNIGYRVSNKPSFLSNYKFTISFENARYPGYTTEKIVEPMLANSVPIYWGNHRVGEEFNVRSFVNCHNYKTFEDVVDEIIRLDQDDGRYLAKMKEPWLIGNVDSVYTKDDYVVPFFERVFATSIHHRPVWSGISARYLGSNGELSPPTVPGRTEFRVFE